MALPRVTCLSELTAHSHHLQLQALTLDELEVATYVHGQAWGRVLSSSDISEVYWVSRKALEQSCDAPRATFAGELSAAYAHDQTLLDTFPSPSQTGIVVALELHRDTLLNLRSVAAVSADLARRFRAGPYRWLGGRYQAFPLLLQTIPATQRPLRENGDPHPCHLLSPRCVTRWILRRSGRRCVRIRPRNVPGGPHFRQTCRRGRHALARAHPCHHRRLCGSRCPSRSR